MASTTTINTWIDQLATSLLARSKSSSKRGLTETFRRKLRHHPYGRANQFDVKDRLDGLEEKFQILNRDDLSDTIYERRLELRDHDDLRWLPDALDLLLRLSNDPIGKTSLTALYDIDPKPTTPSALKWSDIEADDPFDEDDPIWKKPDWSDLSSEEDEVDATSTTKTSPQSVKRQRAIIEAEQADVVQIFEQTQPQEYERPPELIPDSSTLKDDTRIVVEETQLIREILLMIQAYPSTLFVQSQKYGIRLDKRITLTGVSASVPGRLLHPIISIRRRIDMIQKWLRRDFAWNFLQAIQEGVSNVLQVFLNKVNNFARSLVQPEITTIVTLLGLVDFLEEAAIPVRTVASYIQQISRSSLPDPLGQLYEAMCRHFYCHDEAGVTTLTPIFLKALTLYMIPVTEWLKYGKLGAASWPFFVELAKRPHDRSTFWRDGHMLNLDETHLPPAFLLPYAKDMFICGKTSEFLHLLQRDARHDQLPDLDFLEKKLQRIVEEDSIVPFPAAFDSLLSATITGALQVRTTALKRAFNDQCGLGRCLDAIDHIYLRKNGLMMDKLENKIFKRMDRCQDNWNDRFLVADILEDICTDFQCIDTDSIAVRSIHTSSRSMESRRRSVKVMGALAIEYTLPWPIANIIPKASMTAYCRVSLLLGQIRRAKYVLERVAFATVHSSTIGETQGDHKLVQAFTFILITFANTLYDHFAMGVINPLTDSMRVNLHAASTIDAMVSVHRSYMARLQSACLITKNFKVVRDTMIDLLDTCIRFADLVSSAVINIDSTATTTKRRHSDDLETNSFMSAQSRTRRKKRLQNARKRAGTRIQHDDDVLPSSSSAEEEDEEEETENSTDDEDALISSGEGDGYSSFIVLDENTTVMMEIKRLKAQFRRQLDFFIAGLVGVSKAQNDEARPGQENESIGVEGLDVLAERLTWKARRVGLGISN